MRVLTYSATGVQGGPVARRLLERGHRVRALVRHPDRAEGLRRAGAEIMAGDMADLQSLTAASDRADAVFFHLPLIFDRETGMAYARNAVDAAQRAGVRLFVFNTSGIIPEEDTTVLHLEIKREIQGYLAAVEMPSVVLRPRLYLETFNGPWIRPALIEHGIIPYPFPSSYRASWITVEDAGALAVEALERPELAGSTFDVGGPRALTGDEIAEEFSRSLGRPVRYQFVPVEEFERQLQHGLGEFVGKVISQSFYWYEQAGPDRLVVKDMDPVTARLPVRLTELRNWIERQNWSPDSVNPADLAHL